MLSGMLANIESIQPRAHKQEMGHGMLANNESMQPSEHKQEMGAQTKDMAC
jgi:hypothetical protein